MKYILKKMNSSILTDSDEKKVRKELSKIKNEKISELVDKWLKLETDKFMLAMKDHWEDSDFKKSDELFYKILELKKEIRMEAENIGGNEKTI